MRSNLLAADLYSLSRGELVDVHCTRQWSWESSPILSPISASCLSDGTQRLSALECTFWLSLAVDTD